MRRLAFIAFAAALLTGCGGTNGPDPYQGFALGQDQDAVTAKATHAYGEATKTSDPYKEPFCLTWASPYTTLCFVGGQLYSKSR